MRGRSSRPTGNGLRISRIVRTDRNLRCTFSGPGGKWQVSKAGGAQAFWPRGKELFYVSIDFQMIGVEFEVQGNNFLVGKSRRLFEGQSVSSSLGQNPDGSASVDVNEDGTRWLVALPVDERNASPLGASPTNWMAEVKK